MITQTVKQPLIKRYLSKTTVFPYGIRFFSRGNELREVVNLIREAKSISKQEVIIMVICPSEVVQWTETMLSKLALFPYIHWVGLNFVNFVT